MNSNQNKSSEEINAVPSSEQNELPADNLPPPLENEEAYTAETPTLILQTEPPMEVHHHGHVHETKKWKEYLFQFLMLFLAVFCGFLAEYKLEHTIEHQREEKYMVSMIEDLKKDHEVLTEVIAFNIRKFHGLDTLATMLNKELITSEDEKKLYVLNRRYANNVSTMVFNDGTVRQLLSSGNMRLINKQSVSDSVMSYYGQPKEDMLAQAKVYEEMSVQLFTWSDDIFDRSSSMLQMKNDSSFHWVRDVQELPLLSRERKVLKKYAQKIILSRELLSVYLSMLFDMAKRAENLLAFLEKEYD